MEHIVILGNGISGVTAARHIRKLSDKKITIVSAETDYFFSRTALMYVYMRHMNFEHTQPYENWFWDKNRIALKKGYVNTIDFDNKTLHFDNEDSLQYDKLILAVGSKPNKFGWPGQDLNGVQGLYSKQDLDLLEQNAPNNTVCKRAVIIGGGLIGVELAEMLSSRNIPVTFLIRESLFWNNVLPDGDSALITEHIKSHHIDLRINSNLKEIKSDGNGRVESVVIEETGETIPCNVVGLTAGVSPNIDFLKNSKLELGKGIKINEFLETNIPDVYAIGDCAEHRNPIGNRPPVEAVWYTGRMMGEVLAQTICGNKMAYKPGHWFNSAKFFDIEYQTYGWVHGKRGRPDYEAHFHWKHPDNTKCITIAYNKHTNTFLGINTFGIRMRHKVFDAWLTEKRTVDFVIENLKQANFDPEFFKSYESDILNQFKTTPNLIMSSSNPSLSLANTDNYKASIQQKLALAVGLTGILILALAAFNVNFPLKGVTLAISLSLIFIGTGWYTLALYKSKAAGIKNDGVWSKQISSRGLSAWVWGVAITGFYVILYFYEGLLGVGTNGEANSGVVALFDPLSQALSGRPASQWFLYGTLYTVAILAFGIKFMYKYRHNKYQLLRTWSVMFFQLAFAFIIPEIMARLNGDIPYYDLKNVWPLNYYNFEQYRIDGFISAGTIGIALLIFGIASIFIITPILTYKYGKRWYCSWVCGCGGLAETIGDPFRQLSDKRLSAWRFERWLIHLVLVFAVVMTTAVVYTYLKYNPEKYWLSKDVFLLSVGGFLTLLFIGVWKFKRQEFGKDVHYAAIGLFAIILAFIGMHYSTGSKLFFIEAETLRSSYGFLIGAVFSGVVGTGFYPLLGSRVWCRFACPMAAILGFQQRLFSKFRITTNGGQCISCGNCSTYCEMGIDVRAYAQKGENIVRSSCVGCGICSAVCPRGVLKLENDSMNGRINPNEILLGNDVNLMDLVNKK